MKITNRKKTMTITIYITIHNIRWENEENFFRFQSPSKIDAEIKVSKEPKDQYDLKDLVDDYLIDFCGDCDCSYSFERNKGGE
jgi:hypothetical protein